MNFRETDWVGIVNVNDIYIVAVERVRGAPPICVPHCAVNVKEMRALFDRLAASGGTIKPFSTQMTDQRGVERRFAIFSANDPQWLPETAVGGMQ